MLQDICHLRLDFGLHNLIKNEKTYPLTEIKFKPQTYLNEIFETAYRKKYPIVINPNDTISSKRQEAEQYLRLFASISDISIFINRRARSW